MSDSERIEIGDLSIYQHSGMVTFYCYPDSRDGYMHEVISKEQAIDIANKLLKLAECLP